MALCFRSRRDFAAVERLNGLTAVPGIACRDEAFSFRRCNGLLIRRREVFEVVLQILDQHKVRLPILPWANRGCLLKGA